MEKQEITLENILERYKDTAGPGDQQAVIALLREVQQLYGCVPDSVQQRVAKATGTAPSLIAALVQSQPLSKEDFEEIRALLDRGEDS